MGEPNRPGSRIVKGITLIELVCAGALLGIVMAAANRGLTFFNSQIATGIERQNMHMQIDSAFEDMKLRTTSAVSTETPFSTGGSSRNVFRFSGESDIYSVTPDELGDNVTYQYYVNAAGDLVVRTESGAAAEEVLVEKRFQPTLSFAYAAGDEPNVVTVTITARTNAIMMGGSNVITKTDCLRFWFLDVVS